MRTNGFFLCTLVLIPVMASTQNTYTAITRQAGSNAVFSPFPDSGHQKHIAGPLLSAGPAWLTERRGNDMKTVAGRLNLHSLLPGTLPAPRGAVFSIEKANISYRFNNGAGSVSTGKTASYIASVHSEMRLFNVPFSFGYSTHTSAQQLTDQFSTGAIRFDREAFLQQIKDRLKKTVKPEALFADALNRLQAKRDEVFASMHNELIAVLSAGNPMVLNEVQGRLNVDNLSFLGIDRFMEGIVNQNEKQIAAKLRLLEEIQARHETGVPADSLADLTAQIAALQQAKTGTEQQVQQLKSKWLGSGMLETIFGFEKEKQAVLGKLMDDPSEILKAARNWLRPIGLEKLLLYAKRFNIGTSAPGYSGMAMNDVLVKGVNTEFLKGNRFFAPVVGTQPGIRSLADYAYSNFSELADVFTAALRIGKGDMQNDFSHVTLGVFQPNNNRFLPGSFYSALPKNLVATFSKRISLAASHQLQTEVSRSMFSGTTLHGGQQPAAIAGSMGFSLDYNGTFEQANLEEHVAMRYTDKGYSNYGNAYLPGGTKEISNDMRKYFLNRKLVATAKVQFREYSFGVDEKKWRSMSYLADVKWKFRKGEYVELRYQPYFNSRISKEECYTTSRSQRLALRGNINRKVARGLSYRNFIELASSDDVFYDPYYDKIYSNDFISFTMLQTLVVRNHSFFVNVTGNYARHNTGYVFGNSSLSVDAGTSFWSGRNISLSSSLVYNTVDELYHQLAIRQSVSATFGKRLQVEGFIHAGRNFKQQQDFYFPAITGNLSISYNLK